MQGGERAKMKFEENWPEGGQGGKISKQ